MTLRYTYKDSEGTRHEGMIEAPNRDEAFAALRRRGIRPIRVEASANAAGGKGKWLLGGVGVVIWTAVAVLAAAAVVQKRGARPPDDAGRGGGKSPARSGGIVSQVVTAPSEGRVARPRARKPIPGFERLSRQTEERFSRMFNHPSEAYLARFAQPGLEVPSLAEVAVMELLEDDLQDALDDPIVIKAEDSRSVAELKRVVSGLKEEVSLLLASGKSLGEVRSWLEGRQRMESAYRRQIVRRVDDGLISLDEANSLLVSMGFAPKGK